MICAREYKVPCVVARQFAAKRIPDGAIVTVDGSKGTVTIEARRWLRRGRIFNRPVTRLHDPRTKALLRLWQN